MKVISLLIDFQQLIKNYTLTDFDSNTGSSAKMFRIFKLIRPILGMNGIIIKY